MQKSMRDLLSYHAPPLLEEDWQRIPLNSGESQEPVICEYRKKLVAEYWRLVSTMVSNGRDDRDMTPSECQAWIQTRLALTPFCGHAMNTSLDWAVAWSLVGEWTTRTIFLPPKGEWPRQGHPKNLLPPYDQRSVPVLTWATWMTGPLCNWLAYLTNSLAIIEPV